MTFRIGFAAEEERTENAAEVPVCAESATPRRSVVQVRFPGRGPLAYYNDRFDLRRGDMVYVDGKLEGQRGRVTDVQYNFRINLADYKRVIAVADTRIRGTLRFAGSHCVTFDRGTLPKEKVVSWFKAPPKAEDEFVTGTDDSAFPLDDLVDMHIDTERAARGHTYYLENRVRYFCLDGTKGYALVEGTKPYDVEFEYADGMIRSLTCSCFCSGPCKHEFAAMLQLRDTLDAVQEDAACAGELERTGYLAAVGKDTLFGFAVGDMEKGTLTLGGE